MRAEQDDFHTFDFRSVSKEGIHKIAIVSSLRSSKFNSKIFAFLFKSCATAFVQLKSATKKR